MDETSSNHGEAQPGPEPITLFRYRFANAEFDEAKNQLSVGGALVPVEPKPLRLLAELLHHVNEVVTKDELFDQVWDGRPTVDNVLANAVNKLRKALGTEASARIVSLPRVGYRLDGPLERTVVGQPELSPLDLKPGMPVPGRPNFKLERALGAGSRRPVWLARHTRLDQAHVFKFAADAQGLRSLKREFTLFRVLKAELGERPDFATVLDANFSEPPFFIECEYGGQDLLEWAAEDDRLNKMPREERLALFVQIAEAVAAAHSVGVLHKDIKPANILVQAVAGGGWQALLTDFGSGHVIQAERVRQLGLTALGLTLSDASESASIAGSAIYMAPELISGQSPTIQSDLFSLGIILYQLLVGDLRQSLLPGWQNDIDDNLLASDILASTERILSSRLSSAVEFVDRLKMLPDRHRACIVETNRENETLKAKSDAQRSQARRPWVITAVAVLLIGFLSSVAFGLSYRSAASAARLEAEKAQAFSDFFNKDVLNSLDITRIGNARLDTIGDVLSRATNQVSKRFAGQPISEASVHCRLGELLMRVDSSKSALREFSNGANILSAMVEGDELELLRCRYGKVRAMAATFQEKEAEIELKGIPKSDWDRTARGAKEIERLALMANIDVLAAREKYSEALPHALALVTLMKNDLFVNDLQLQFEAKQRLAEVLFQTQDLDGAKAIVDGLLAPPYSVENVGEVTMARARIEYAKGLVKRERYSEALAILITTRTTLTNALGPRALQVAFVNYELANAASAIDDFQLSQDALKLALFAFSESMGAEHAYVISIKSNLAVVDAVAGKSAQAIDMIDQLLPWYKNNGHEVDALNFYRGLALNDLRRFAEALVVLDSINPEAFEKQHHEGQKGTAYHVQAERGRAIRGLGRTKEGIQLIKDAVAKMDAVGAPKDVVQKYAKFAL